MTRFAYLLLICMPVLTTQRATFVLNMLDTALTASDEASRSARHHWEALLCSKILPLPLSNAGGQMNSDQVTFEGGQVSTPKSSSGSGGSGVKRSPCKSMKRKYQVTPGVSWGLLTAPMQM